MPSKSSQGRANMWYSFNVGPVHFVTLNTETDFPGAEESKTGDGHIKWLKAGSFGAEGGAERAASKISRLEIIEKTMFAIHS